MRTIATENDLGREWRGPAVTAPIAPARLAAAGAAVACWGNNQNGQASPPGAKFKSASAGRRHNREFG